MSKDSTLPCCAKMAALSGRVAPEYISRNSRASPWVKSGSEGDAIVGDTSDTGETGVTSTGCSSKFDSLGVWSSETGSCEAEVGVTVSTVVSGCTSQWVVFWCWSAPWSKPHAWPLTGYAHWCWNLHESPNEQPPVWYRMHNCFH